MKIEDLNLNGAEIVLACLILNNVGAEGQHPYADDTSIKYFDAGYLKSLYDISYKTTLNVTSEVVKSLGEKLSNVQPKDKSMINWEHVPEFIKSIDWGLLRTQKNMLLELIPANDEQGDDIEGIVLIIDALQDYIVDEVGIDAVHVFDFETEEKRDNSTDEPKQKSICVYVVIENKSEDYHGTYKEIIAIFNEKEAAVSKIKELEEENYNCNIEYDYDIYNVE